MPLPNTILIGAQKAGTSSLYDWIAQHPEVCGDISIKDFGFFAFDVHYSKGADHLSDCILKYYKNEKVILHGSVQYIFYHNSLKRIKKYCPTAKFILILRDPVERLFSAFNYFKKMQLENEEDVILASINRRKDRENSEDIRIRNELTYIEHGLYAKQLKIFFKYFSAEQLHICFFNDLKENKEETIKDIYKFLEVKDSFSPDFSKKNVTGEIRSNFLQKIFFKKNKLRRYVVDNFIDYFLPLQKRSRLRWKIKEWNTKKNIESENEILSKKDKSRLLQYFIDDIEELEKMLHIDLDRWKRI